MRALSPLGRMLLLAAAAVLGGGTWAAPLRAQGGGGGAPFTIQLSPATVSFPNPTVSHFDAGVIDHSGVTVTVKPKNSNKLWELGLSSQDATLGGYGKPLQDILWRLDGSSTWTSLSTSDQAVFEGTGDQTFTIFFRILLSWAQDPPDTYGLTMTFAAVHP